MAHKTLINGTAHEITGGLTLVEGTSYSVKNGRVLVGGASYDINFMPYDSIFVNNDWATIIQACQNNNVPDSWEVGNQKAMVIDGVDYQIDIIGKNHDSYSDGSGKAPLTFQFHDCYRIKYNINSNNTNANGWEGCKMRNTYLPAIKSLMPTAVQNAIKNVNKQTSAGNKSVFVMSTDDDLFLLSEVEIFGSTIYSVAGEGSQYEYYSASNSKVKNHSGSACQWWERSPYSSNTTAFCYVYTDGTANATSVTSSFGLAPAFCF